MTDPWLRRLARHLLIHRVRGHAPASPAPQRRGSDWGEAMLAEFEHTAGSWEAVRWTLSSWRAARAIDPLPAAARWRRRSVVVVTAVTILALPVNAYAASFAQVPSGAMAPTLQVADRVLVEKLSHRFTGVRHGDIVVVRVRGQDMIKRVLGLPGDAIACPDGVMTRNGIALREHYEPAGTVTQCDPITVPTDSLYLLGDNREASADSRHWGTVPITDVIGRVVASF